MIEPTQEDIGRTVIYTGNTYPGGKPEEGVITSFNDKNVFVRYGANHTSHATARDDLEWDEWRGNIKSPVDIAPGNFPEAPAVTLFVEIAPHEGADIEAEAIARLLTTMATRLWSENFVIPQGPPQARTVIMAVDVVGAHGELVTAPSYPGE